MVFGTVSLIFNVYQKKNKCYLVLPACASFCVKNYILVLRLELMLGLGFELSLGLKLGLQLELWLVLRLGLEL